MLLPGAIAVVVGGTKCSSGPSEGTPCTATQVGQTSPGSDACESLLCDGKEFGPVIAAPGDPCSDSGLTCPLATGGGAGGDPCPDATLMCDGTKFVVHEGVGPGVACNRAGAVCHWPGTECDSCTCDGTTFHCKQNCCVVSACDGGPPANVCPAPALVVAGESCNSQLTCPSTNPCEGGASGACTCASGSWACQCVAPPVALASGENGPSHLAVDATSVYWTDYQDGTVRKLAKGGGTPQTIASGQTEPTAIAVDSTNVYWVDSGTSDLGSVMTAPLAGGAVVVLASNQRLPNGIAVDATNVYWAASESVMTVPLAGGTPTTLVTAQEPIDALTIDATNVYWSSYGTLAKLPLAGGTPTSLAYVQFALGIAVDATSVYWTQGASDAYDGTVTTIPIAVGATTVLATDQDAPTAVAVDATDVYWIDSSNGVVMKVAKTGGGTPIILALGQGPGDLAVDAANVYWTDGVAGTVMMTPK